MLLDFNVVVPLLRDVDPLWSYVAPLNLLFAGWQRFLWTIVSDPKTYRNPSNHKPNVELQKIVSNGFQSCEESFVRSLPSIIILVEPLVNRAEESFQQVSAFKTLVNASISCRFKAFFKAFIVAKWTLKNMIIATMWPLAISSLATRDSFSDGNNFWHISFDFICDCAIYCN